MVVERVALLLRSIERTPTLCDRNRAQHTQDGIEFILMTALKLLKTKQKKKRYVTSHSTEDDHQIGWADPIKTDRNTHNHICIR